MKGIDKLHLYLYLNVPSPQYILFFLHNFDAKSKSIQILSIPNNLPDLKIIIILKILNKNFKFLKL